MLQATSQEEMHAWISTLQNATASLLGVTRATRASFVSSIQGTVLGRVRQVAGNTACADCGAANPSWASINLGVLVCLSCAGVHRQLPGRAFPFCGRTMALGGAVLPGLAMKFPNGPITHMD